MIFQPPIPDEYMTLSYGEITTRIRCHKEQFGRRLVVLGHHYQQDDVIRFADFRGDSLKLSQLAAKQKQADYVVFCGVHFMAESADILTDDSVAVILPDLSAGCSMADMAEPEQLIDAWKVLADCTEDRIVPITYVNSSAAIKAFCGKHGGACCTSSNAQAVLEWALREGDKVLFLPDQHLGRNTAYGMGHSLDSMIVWDPVSEHGGVKADEIRRARLILWNGWCSVHQLFTVKQCEAVRNREPERKIIVHPECSWAVVQRADMAGSTEFIIQTIDAAEPGTKWAIGTESNLVGRLANSHPDKDIRSLATIQCVCTTMYRISPQHLLWSLDELAAGRESNRISVDEEVSKWARVALQRMLENAPSEAVAISRDCSQ